MHKKYFENGYMQNLLQPRLKKAENQLGVEQIDTIRDPNSKQLILLVSGHHMDCCDVYAFMNGTKLILEAPLPFYYGELPFRRHLIGEGSIEHYTNDDPNIGFSEIILNPEFHYKVLSYNVLNPGLIKVVLYYTDVNRPKKSKTKIN